MKLHFKNDTQYTAVLENREDDLSGIKDTNVQTHLHPCAITRVAHTQINRYKKLKLRRQKRQGEERVQKLVFNKLLNGNKLKV